MDTNSLSHVPLSFFVRLKKWLSSCNIVALFFFPISFGLLFVFLMGWIVPIPRGSESGGVVAALGILVIVVSMTALGMAIDYLLYRIKRRKHRK